MLLRVSTYIALVVITGMTARTSDTAATSACATSALPEIRIALETPQDALRLLEWAKHNKLATAADIQKLQDDPQNLVRLVSSKLRAVQHDAGNKGQMLQSVAGISLPEGLRISHWSVEKNSCKN